MNKTTEQILIWTCIDPVFWQNCQEIASQEKAPEKLKEMVSRELDLSCQEGLARELLTFILQEIEWEELAATLKGERDNEEERREVPKDSMDNV